MLCINQDCIFDPDKFATELASHPGNSLSIFKQALAAGNDALKDAFYNNADTVALVKLRAAFIDQILVHAFAYSFAECHQQVALVAVGGYGRGELHPASDIDIMLLLAEQEGDATRQAIEHFLMLLWDIKLEIGHSVRTVQDCIQEASADITVATNIMEARFLAGDDSLFKTMRAETGPDKIWDSKSFFQAKLEEQIKRHHKFHDTAYNLEPHIKENPGGLRDIQMIGWVTKRHFGAQTLEELIQHGFLTRNEYQKLIDGQTLLWRIRLCLHYITGRREDRLLFDLQQQLATHFGYKDGENNLAIEQFMQAYYRTVMELERLNELLLQLFREAILYADAMGEPEIINARFQVINGYIEARYPGMFQEHPTALLELFLILEQRPDITGVRAQTIRLIRENVHLIDDKFRQNETARQLFIDIIRQQRGITHELRRMNRYGLLAAYIPAFEQIVGRMQYDLFHAYTVDQHTLFVLRNIRRLSVPEYAHEFPLASGIFHHLDKPELLYLAGIFHDIAKGRGGDHAVLGAEDAEAFCQHHGLEDADGKLVAWLVRHHLLMSMVAQRKDLSDPEVIFAFSQQVENQRRLDYLYLLTISDIRATNPKLWNSWKDNLLAELYHKASKTLRIGLKNPINRDIMVMHNQTAALRFLSGLGHAPEEVNNFWKHFTDDYFLHHTPSEIRWHGQILLDANIHDLPQVHARLSEMGRIEILIYTHEHDELFARIASAIDQLGLSIMDAQIMVTDDGYTLDTFKVMEQDGSSPSAGYRIKEIVDRLKQRLTPGIPMDIDETRPRQRVQKYFQVDTTVKFEQVPAKDMTLMTIATADRPGLLARIGKAFLECNIRVHKAKISTAGERADDSFDITDNHNQPLLDEAVCQQLRNAVIRHLSQ
ncbi:MAG: [protein-PII] uridylyltransferase [Gammaproteobacteria bacterium]|nr:MAG: [protein-PII] uridylyltransferase [Gammaproteobacteria bacterium]